MENTEIKMVYVLKEIYTSFDESWEDVIGVFSHRDSAHSARVYLMKQNPDVDARFKITEYELLN